MANSHEKYIVEPKLNKLEQWSFLLNVVQWTESLDCLPLLIGDHKQKYVKNLNDIRSSVSKKSTLRDILIF